MCRNRKWLVNILLPFVLLATTFMAKSGVVVGGTRVVYESSKKEASIAIKNPDAKPYLIQSWVDGKGESGDKTESGKPPFIATPPLFRLEASGENVLRIIRTGGHLPEDRESVYWLNIKSIPSVKPSEGRNTLQVAVKTRIKLFYRPANLKKVTSDDFAAVKFSYNSERHSLVVNNPMPYWITFYSLKVNGKTIDTENHMSSPLGETYYPSEIIPVGSKVEWSVINEYGGSSVIMRSEIKL